MFLLGRRHELGGFVIRDLIDDTEGWLMDIAMSEHVQPGPAFFGRLMAPGPFSMTCGVAIPLAEPVLEAIDAVVGNATGDALARIRTGSRLPFTVYQTAIRCGAMEQVMLV